MQSASFTIHEVTDPQAVAKIRSELKHNGFSVVRAMPPETASRLTEGLDRLALELRPDGGTAHGSKGMGGIVKWYGAASYPAVAEARLSDPIRELFASLFGLPPKDLAIGWDAPVLLGTDGARQKPPSDDALHHKDAKKAYAALTGSSLQPHVDIGRESYGARMQELMKEVHPTLHNCVQAQLVLRDVPAGGATLVVAPGAYYGVPPDERHFVSDPGKDFCVCTTAGYEHFREKWRAVAPVPAGCLILWLSATPHGNKAADYGVDPQRRGVFISWQARALLEQEQREAAKKRKLEVILAGGSTDHWAYKPTAHRGGHYSNGKGLTKVLYSANNPPQYDEALFARIKEAM